MATQVNSLYTASIGNKASGNVQVVSSQPALLAVSNTAGVLTFSPTAGGVSSVNGLSGNPVITNADGNLTVSNPALSSDINIATTTATNGGTAVLVAQNTAGALAWAGSGTPAVSTVAYAVGAIVIYSGDTYVCLVAQAIGTSFPVNGANWQTISDSSGTPTSISNFGGSVSIDTAGHIIATSSNAGGGNIQINSVGGDGTIGVMSLSSGSSGIVIDPCKNATPPSATGTLVYNCGSWSGSGTPAVSTVPYAVGAMVIYGGDTYVCLVAQAVGTSFPVNGANWLTISDSSGTPTQIANGVGDTAGVVSISSVGVISAQPPSEIGVEIAPSNPSAGGKEEQPGKIMYNVGTWSSTLDDAYSLGAVVQYSGVSYVCILAITNSATPTSPDTDSTHWLPLDSGTGGTPTQIANGTAPNIGSVAVDATGNILAQDGTATAQLVLSTTGGVSLAQLITGFTGGQLQLVPVKAEGVDIVPDPADTIPPIPGKVLYNTGAWANTAGYGVGSVVLYNDVYYICIAGYVAPTPPAVATVPSATPINWSPFPPPVKQATYFKSANQLLTTGSLNVISFDSTGTWNNTGGYITQVAVVAPTLPTQFLVNRTGLYQFSVNAVVITNTTTYSATENRLLSLSLLRPSTGATNAILVFQGLTATNRTYGQSLNGSFYCLANDVLSVGVQATFTGGAPSVSGINTAPNAFDLNTYFSWTYISG